MISTSRFRDDGGAVAVTVALLMVLLVLMAGFVLDLGLARVDRQANQTVADFAATAAVDAMHRATTDPHQAACLAAVDYFRANSPGVGPVTQSPHPCASFADAVFSCSSAASPVTAVIALDAYELQVTMPVPDGHAMLAGQAINRDVDGYDGCSRVGVRVEREREHLFAVVGGFDAARPASDAVARVSADGQSPEYATLVVLDPHGCQVVSLNGNGTAVIIEDLDETVTGDANGDGELEVFPGIITIDSDGTTGAPCYLLNPSANSSRICAGVAEATADAIFAAPNAPARPPCNSSVDTLLTEAEVSRVADPTYYSPPKPQVDPFPARRGRITRQPIDHRYNCRSDYYPSPTSAHLPIAWGGTPVQPCAPASPRSGHIDDLVTAYGGLSKLDALLMGWTVIENQPGPGDDCKNASAVYGPGNYYVDCPGTNGNQGFVVSNVEFQGPGTIVFAGSVNVKGTLRINTTDSADSIAVIQTGNLNDAGGVRTELHRTFVYLASGVVDLRNDLVWDAPRDAPYEVRDEQGNLVEDGPCDAGEYTGAPPAPCFQNLAAWTNSASTHDIGGGAVFSLDGIFFSPNAGHASGTEWFKLHGGPGYRLEHAQFFAYDLLLDGGAVLTMRPDPDRFEETPVVGGGLIR